MIITKDTPIQICLLVDFLEYKEHTDFIFSILLLKQKSLILVNLINTNYENEHFCKI